MFGIKIDDTETYLKIFFPLLFGQWWLLSTILIILKILTWLFLYATKLNLDIESFTAMNRPFTLLIALTIFMYFKNLNIKQNKIINTISSTTFGVYIIHTQYILKNYYWHSIFKCDIAINSPYFILYSILSIIVVFTICSLIDIFYKKL